MQVSSTVVGLETRAKRERARFVFNSTRPHPPPLLTATPMQRSYQGRILIPCFFFSFFPLLRPSGVFSECQVNSQHNRTARSCLGLPATGGVPTSFSLFCFSSAPRSPPEESERGAARFVANRARRSLRQRPLSAAVLAAAAERFSGNTQDAFVASRAKPARRIGCPSTWRCRKGRRCGGDDERGRERDTTTKRRRTESGSGVAW